MINKILLVLSLFWSISSYSSDIDTLNISDLSAENHYSRRLANLLNQYEKILKVWLINPESKNNINLRYDSIAGVSAKYFDDLETFIKTYEQNPKTPDNLSELQKQLDSVLEKSEGIRDEFAYLNELDYDFDIVLFAIHKALDVLNHRLRFVREHYEEKNDQETIISIDLSREHIKEMALSIRNMRVQNKIITRKRSNAYFKAFKLIQKNLKIRFANQADTELSKIEKMILDVFAADKMIVKVFAWSSKYNTNGTGGFANFPYFQYQETVRNVSLAISEGRPLKQEIEDLKIAEKSKNIIRRKFNREMEFQVEELAKIKTQGWIHYDKAHIRRAKRWKSRPDDFSKKCVEWSEIFISKYNKDKSFEEYLIQEAEFKDLTVICQGDS